jgi:hypothetical protein
MDTTFVNQELEVAAKRMLTHIAGSNEETQQLLSLYRLLRHLGEIPWLLERGFKALAERNIMALRASSRA